MENSLFLDVISDPEKYSDLLDGCEYETRNGNKRVFLGLKKSICYYSYARLMKNGDYNVNRFGTSNKDSEYSSNTDYKEKVIAYNDAFDVADRYLKECVLYLNENKDRYPLYRGKGGLRSNRTIYRVLGD